jgi:predicted outer membrane repeat protein
VGSGTLTWPDYFPISQNTATTGDGGGIYIKYGTVTGSIQGLIENNSAANGNGGGIYNFAGTLTLKALTKPMRPKVTHHATGGNR